MLRAGDELGQSQLGNNNAYCQDNELSWLDWTGVKDQSKVLSDHGDFIARLIQISKRFPKLRNHEFLHPPQTREGISIHWLNSDGQEMRQEHWAQHQNFSLGYKLTDNNDQSAVLVIFNNGAGVRPFSIPAEQAFPKWHWLLDSTVGDGNPTDSTAVACGSTIDISACSVAVLSNQPSQF